MLTLPNLKTFAERLIWARERAGLTQEELAEKSKMSRDIIAKAETGKTKRPKRMKDLADALEVPPAWLAFGDDRIDQWDEETLLFAESFSHLPPEVREAVKTLINNMFKKVA